MMPKRLAIYNCSTRDRLPIPFPEGKEPTPHAQRGHLPHRTLRHGRRLLPLRAARRRPGPQTSLSEREVLTLAIFARWSRFTSERDFYRYAEANLREAFPTLPDRSQFNRLVRSCAELIEAFVSHLASLLTDAQ